jgi:hypothetical protein
MDEEFLRYVEDVDSFKRKIQNQLENAEKRISNTENSLGKPKPPVVSTTSRGRAK